jgi:DUF1009 family protein
MPMTRTDTSTPDANNRVGIIAGGGALPVQVVQSVAHAGGSPFVLMIGGEVDDISAFSDFEHETLELEQLSQLVPTLKRHRVTHLVMAGTIKRRPKVRDLQFSLSMLGWLPAAVRALSQGDNNLLSLVIREIEKRGIKVVGAHEVAGQLLAVEGAYTTAGPEKGDWRDIEAAREAALAIGRLDIGQAAVSIGGRVIALEGIEGTDGLLARVRDLRDHGRLAGRRRGVLVKCAKPDQELRADLPTIGAQTIETAHQAGLAGVAVEAGHALVLDGPELVARANALGLFVIGLKREGGAQ